jgi:hypothetical protein
VPVDAAGERHGRGGKISPDQTRALCGWSEHRKRGSAVGLARASMTKWTEQVAYLGGIDRPQAPALREEGTAEMLDRLTRYRSKQPSELTGHR